MSPVTPPTPPPAPRAQPTGRRLPVTSGAAAIAMAVVAVFVWWFASGNSPFAPRGNGELMATPSVAPTAAASGETSPPALANPRGVAIDSYVLADPRRLVVNFATGSPACVGVLDTPAVLENEGSVTVTLSLVPPVSPAEACDLSLRQHSVTVDLDSPLTGKALLDGSFSPPVRVERTDTAYPAG